MKLIIQKLWMVMAMLSVSISVFAYDFDVDGQLFFEILSTSELTCKLVSVNENYEGTLIIPEKVTFKGRDLTVTTIGSGCIKANTKLTHVKINNTISKMEQGCFSESVSLQSADISQYASTQLSSDIFKNCISLTNVDFPKSVTCIPSNFFYGCSSLSTFEIPAWITIIASDCFYGCTSLSEIRVPEGVELIGDGCFSNSGICSISLPTTLRSLGKEAFKGTKIEASLKLPNGLKSIGDRCFYLASIPHITIPASVESIGNQSFSDTDIKSIEFEEESTITELGDGMFKSSKIESVILPSNLEKIGKDCFSSCLNLTKIEFPESLRSLSRNSLANLKLDTLTIPISVEYMPEWCFGGNFIEFASIKHFIWAASNINEDAYHKYLSFSSESSEITWAGYALEQQSCYLGPIETFEISKSCDFLSLGFFAESDDLYTGPLFKYCGINKLIIDDSEKPLILGSIYSTGNRRKYKLFHNFPDNTDCKYFKDYWMKSVEELYIGREIDGNPLCVPNLKRLCIGNVKNVNIENSRLPNLEIIECTSKMPPSISDAHFSTEQYIDLRIVVPDDAVEEYRNADVWKNFWNITSKSEYEAGIDVLVSPNHNYISVSIDGITFQGEDSAIIIICGIDGKCQYSGNVLPGQSIALSKGIYIVTLDGKSIKVKI